MVPTRDRTIAPLAQQGKEKGQPREVVTKLSSVDGTGVRVGYSQHRMCAALQRNAELCRKIRPNLRQLNASYASLSNSARNLGASAIAFFMNAVCFHLLHVRPSQGLAAELKANAISSAECGAL
jgi:hypothetical protein